MPSGAAVRNWSNLAMGRVFKCQRRPLPHNSQIGFGGGACQRVAFVTELNAIDGTLSRNRIATIVKYVSYLFAIGFVLVQRDQAVSLTSYQIDTDM